jgi:hypothetical protein
MSAMQDGSDLERERLDIERQRLDFERDRLWLEAACWLCKARHGRSGRAVP